MELYEQLTDLNNIDNLTRFLEYLNEKTILEYFSEKYYERNNAIKQLNEYHIRWVYSVADEIERSEMLSIVHE